MIDYPSRIKQLYALLNPCRLCPHNCGVNRLAGQKGKCRTDTNVMVASHNIHHGEEPPISGVTGSGTIFFANCSLSCVYCQNYPISQHGNGNNVTIAALAGMMLSLQKRGAHNINLVTPSHVAPMAVEAIYEARAGGLKLPIIYNCSGYESLETLALLDGIVDIYLPDAKYGDETTARKLSGAAGYWEANKAALKEMYRQVGNMTTDENGIAQRGLIIRHMALPNNLSGSKNVFEFIARELSRDTHLSIMAQYHPAHRAGEYPELSRRLTPDEYKNTLDAARKSGIGNGWQQEL